MTVLCPGATDTGFHDRANIQESNIIKGKKLPTAESVAKFGYKVMMKGQTTKMHGLKNRFLAFLVRFAPRKFVPKIARKFMEK